MLHQRGGGEVRDVATPPPRARRGAPGQRHHLGAEGRPRPTPRVRTTASSVSSTGVRTHTAPSNSVGIAAVDAELLGPGHRVAAHEARVAPTADTIDAFTDPTSVTDALRHVEGPLGLVGDRAAPARR